MLNGFLTPGSGGVTHMNHPRWNPRALDRMVGMFGSQQSQDLQAFENRMAARHYHRGYQPAPRRRVAEGRPTAAAQFARTMEANNKLREKMTPVAVRNRIELEEVLFEG